MSFHFIDITASQLYWQVFFGHPGYLVDLLSIASCEKKRQLFPLANQVSDAHGLHKSSTVELLHDC